MRDRRPWSAAMLLLIGVAACAHAQPEPVTEAVAAVSPKLIGCNGYMPPPALYAHERVEVEVMVLPDGSVASSSPRYRPLGGFDIQKDESVIQEALSLAAGCVFEPAQRGEESVEAWATVRFAFG